MSTFMRRDSKLMAGLAAKLAVILVVSAMTAALAGAQTPAGGERRIGEEIWRISASVGSYVPRSALIVGADGKDTRLSAGSAVSLDVQYLISEYAALYGNGSLAFSTITLGTAIRPASTGPSNQVTLSGGTAGVVLSAPLGKHFQPTLRLGGGYKGYSFDLTDAENQWRPTADVGVGFRGRGNGPIEISAEVRYLPSSFDQAKLPVRGITPQAQRQTDVLFSVGVSIRP